MIQIDPFWAYSFGAGFALAARHQLTTRTVPSVTRVEPKAVPTSASSARHPQLWTTVAFTSLLFVPTGLYLLLAFPSWETMHAAPDGGPPWLGAAAAILNISLAVAGLLVTQALLRRGQQELAFGQLLLGYFGFFFLLVHGWDGTGYQRFFSPTTQDFRTWSNTSTLDHVGDFAGSSAGMAVNLVVGALIVALVICYLRISPTPRAFATAFFACVGLALGLAVMSSMLIHLLGWVGGAVSLALVVGSAVASNGPSGRFAAGLERADGGGAQPLAGKVAVVTGGGRGIGAATVRALAAEGVRVAIGEVDLDAARGVAGSLGEEVIALRLDVSDSASFADFLDEVEDRFGPVDILINNAGIMPIGLLEEEDDSLTARHLGINLHGVINGSREAIRRMRPRNTGHLVNVSSTLGKLGVAGGATYCATKFGVVGLSESLRQELRGTDIDISLVMPAVVRTELASGLGEARGIKSVQPEDVAREIVGALHAPRFDVFVPRSVGQTVALAQPLPRPVREWLTRLLKGDRVLLDSLHSTERADYERRAAGLPS